jgi:hypothetical protein
MFPLSGRTTPVLPAALVWCSCCELNPGEDRLIFLQLYSSLETWLRQSLSIYLTEQDFIAQCQYFLQGWTATERAASVAVSDVCCISALLNPGQRVGYSNGSPELYSEYWLNLLQIISPDCSWQWYNMMITVLLRFWSVITHQIMTRFLQYHKIFGNEDTI